jgi:uncharacterized damage-inducible protein DinB
MTTPPKSDERQSLLAFLAQQRAALRNAAYGLTDDEARTSTTASTLTVGGLVKHVTEAERGWTNRVLGTDTSDPDETLAGLLDLYETEADRTDGAIGNIADLGQDVPLAKGVPWFPESASVRWVLLHMIQETARHAGHADIIRQSLDGAMAGSLMAAAEGWEPTGWVTPWTRA